MIFTASYQSLKDCLGEISPVLESHWRELALNKDKIFLKPNYEIYISLEKQGKFRAYTVRTDGILAGYAGYFIHEHLHYRDDKYALSDLFFVIPKFRRGGLWSRLTGTHKSKGAGTVLFETIEEDLRSIGVSVMITTHKVHEPAAGFMLPKLGHTLIEHGYSKSLK